MKSRELSREITFKFQQFGLTGTINRGLQRAARELRACFSPKRADASDFDVKHGTDTSRVVPVGSLDLPTEAAKHAVRYQTAISEVFIDLLNELPISYDKYVFIDLGSGKGRALLSASNFPFKQIIGIELAPSLHRIACSNISIYRTPIQRCHHIISLCQDAAAYTIPTDNVVIYLFNPFDDQIIAAVLSNIEHSLHTYPRSLYIVYLKPAYRRLFDRSPFLRVFKETDRFVIYQSEASLSCSVDDSLK